MGENECIFCKIVAGDIPAAKVYEDDHVLAFLDIGPIHEGHTLVIPKAHYETVADCPPEVMAALAATLPSLAGAVISTITCDGYNILCNNGRAAGQLVGHMHFHIIPRMQHDGVFDKWPAGQYPEGRIQQLAEQIRKKL
jgi:histidine triad (HIT) family protein